jgi:hypothetical protein
VTKLATYSNKLQHRVTSGCDLMGYLVSFYLQPWSIKLFTIEKILGSIIRIAYLLFTHLLEALIGLLPKAFYTDKKLKGFPNSNTPSDEGNCLLKTTLSKFDSNEIMINADIILVQLIRTSLWVSFIILYMYISI